jgi:hypothetical protein
MVKRKLIFLREEIDGRPYFITAKLNRATGRVLGIKAGCRRWRDFTEALAHYTGGGRYNVDRWQENAYIVSVSELGTNSKIRDLSILALSRLAKRVYECQEKWRRK